MAAITKGSFGVPSSRISSITTPTLSSSSLFLPQTTQSGFRKDKQLRCALQESSSTSAVATEKKDKRKEEKEEVSKVAAPAKKPKPAAAVVKPLRQMMEEDVIPPLKSILESQDDISDIDLSFKEDNKLEGFFIKKGIPYSFWAFFPTGNLTGAKGFSISSHGSGPSTVEPFLVDERKPTANHVVFWVEKRLAAQGIIPVWNQ